VANRERGEQRLIVDGRTFTLRLTVGACCEVEDWSGKDLDGLTAGINDRSVTDLRWVLWAALQAKHPDLDLEHVGRLIDGIGSLSEAVSVVAAFIALNGDDRPQPTTSDGDSKPKQMGWRQVYLDARCLGLTADQFWALSLRELWRELAVAEQQQRIANNRDVTVAWWTVALGRQRRLQSLKTLLATGMAQPKKQTWQDIKAMVGWIAKG
jgi:hypothetical protein